MNAASAGDSSLENEPNSVHSEESGTASSASENDSEKEEDEQEKQLKESGQSKSEHAKAARGTVRSRTDMYKVCDGSALMAIGSVWRHCLKYTVLTACQGCYCNTMWPTYSPHKYQMAGMRL
jgi:hypothetical protein